MRRIYALPDGAQPPVDAVDITDIVEAAVSETLELLPLEGSWDDGYRLPSHDIQPVVQALPEDWAEAAWAVGRLHRALEGLPQVTP